MTRFFGGDDNAPERLCFGYNATDALNLILHGVVSPGDHVVTTTLEHNAVLRPLNHLVRDQQVEVDFVPFDGAGFIDPDAIQRAIRPTTRLVVVNHGSNVIGTIQPLAEIGGVCRDAGVLFVVDTSQTAGVVPIDMTAMKIDGVAFTGHKALMGSTGIGGMCLGTQVELKVTRSGGTGVNSVDPYQPEAYPWRMEIGTPNLVGVAALWAGQEWIEEQGLEAIYAHEMRLTAKLIDGFHGIKGFERIVATLWKTISPQC